MEQRRFILFVVLSTAVLFGWLKFGPLLFPDAFPKPQPKQPVGQQPAADDSAEQDATAPDSGESQPAPELESEEATGAEAPQQPAPEPEAAAEPAELPRFPHDDEILLGSLDPASGYFLQIRLTTEGAAIDSATLNDPRFVTADEANVQLAVVGNAATSLRTLAVDVPETTAQLQKFGESTETVDWEVVSRDESSVVFRYPAPDGSLEVRKSFKLQKGDPADRDGDEHGYLVDVSLEFINLSQQVESVDYAMQGPVGLPLENADNTRTFIEIKVGTAAKPNSPVQYRAATYAKQLEKSIEQNDPAQIDSWRDPLKYVAVDVQYFAALLLPTRDQTKDLDGDGQPNPYFEEVRPVEIKSNKDKPQQTDISVVMDSAPISIAPGATESHGFRLFLGPKRPELLKPLEAGGIITFGWFSVVSVVMVFLLNFFHQNLWLPYGLAIVLLTLIVRACMFPITRRQAAGARKMKELQPKLQELKAKYAKEPEKFWAAQKELFRKHNYSPLSGCLPLFLQMPIFLGLYSALSYDVDLRMAPFLWIDNLAAPDQLFSFGGELPLVHWTHFNLLPIITICLWVVQQKMFMPPAATDEQALQYKMMSYMMIFVGFMIYRVPAGLCVYFITSTLWGISERKLIDYLKSDEKKTLETDVLETTATLKQSTPEAEPHPQRTGWFARLVEAADQARTQSASGSRAASSDSEDGKSKRNGRKRRSGRN